MHGRIFLIILTLAVSGCLQGAPAPAPEPGPENSQTAFAVTADWEGDLFLRFDLNPDEATTCRLEFTATGKTVAEGNYFHIIVQEKDNGAYSAYRVDGPNTQLQPGISTTILGEPIIKTERPSFDHWLVYGTPTVTLPSEGISLSIGARNLATWPSDPGPDDISQNRDLDPLHTLTVAIDCESHILPMGVWAGQELAFFDLEDFAGTASVHLIDGRKSTGSLVFQGKVDTELTGETIELMAALKRAPGTGILAVTHPEGSNEWTFNPASNAFDEGPLIQLRTTGGPIELALDWQGTGNGGPTGFLTEVLELDQLQPLRTENVIRVNHQAQ